MGVVTSLLPGHDALLLQEVHGTSGMLEAWARPRGYRAFFSPGATTGCAGVGILLSETFLQRFEEEPILEEIWKGRAIKVILRGRQGRLYIYVQYIFKLEILLLPMTSMAWNLEISTAAGT